MVLKAGLGLGTFPFTGVFRKVSKHDAIQIIYRFLDLGGQYIESALIYPGVNELLGDSLSEISRESYYLSTKCVTDFNSKGEKVRSGKFHEIISQCERQLTELRTDYIDLLIAHSIPDNTSLNETLEALIQLKKQGKIRDIGLSNITLSQLRKCNASKDVTYIQNRFSLIHQPHSHEMTKYCLNNGIKYIPYQVIERGQLTNHFLEHNVLRVGDFRQTKPEFKTEVLFVIREWISTQLKPTSDALNINLETLVLWWTLRQPNVYVCSIGATSVQQLELNMMALTSDIPVQTLAHINQAYENLEKGISLIFQESVHSFRGLK